MSLTAKNRVPMADSWERVTGHIAYSEDQKTAGMLHCKVVRSPYAHARILEIDTSEAKALSGVITILTGQDLLADKSMNPYYGPQIKDQPILAIDRVRFVGDPVVAVVATSVDIAAKALNLIYVDYEELDASFNEVEAAQQGATLIHDVSHKDFLGSNAYFGIRPIPNTNVCNHYQMRHGDIEAGFSQADVIVEGEFSTPTAAHVPMEGHAVIAQFEGEHLRLMSGTQSPFTVRNDLAGVFNLDPEQISITVPRLGGGFGSKLFTRLEPIAAIMAKVTQKPVRFALERDEEFLTINRHPVSSKMKLGFKQDGTLVAKQAELYYGTGAYADCGPNVALKGGYGSIGPYRIEHFAVDSYCVYTNLPPNGAYRGYAVTQVAWASEALMDDAAKKLGIDPLELRLKNILHSGDTFPTGEVMHDAQYERCLKLAANAVNWQEEDWQARSYPADLPDTIRAKGLAVILKGTTTPSRSEAAIDLDAQGNVVLHMATIDIGQGCRTAMAQCASDVLDIPYDEIKVLDPDTAITPFDNRTSSSRSAYMMGGAVTHASSNLKHKLLDLAAEYFEVSKTDLELSEGFIQVKGVPATKKPLSELLKHNKLDKLSGNANYENEGGLDPETGRGIASSHWHQGAVGVEIEIDTGTGFIRVLKCHPAIYAGRVINQQAAELQTDGSTIMGIGSSFFEEVVFSDGMVMNSNLSDYMIPSFLDLPEDLSHDLIELPNAEIHGLGETSLPLIPVAIGNAIANALGVRVTDLPLTPERVLRAVREAQGKNR